MTLPIDRLYLGGLHMKILSVAKRACALFLVLILLNMTAAFAASGIYYVNVKSVYARSGPASSYSVNKKLKKGDVVSYKDSKNGWYYVKYSGGSGWVYRKYLSSVKNTTGKYKATCGLNIRAKASNGSAIIGKLKKGATVTIKKQSHGYAYISYKGNTGWVAAKYLKKK